MSQLPALDEVSVTLLRYKENIFYTRDLTLAFRPAERRGRTPCMNPFCKFLRLKIILMPKWHISEQRIPPSSVYVGNSRRSRVSRIQRVSSQISMIHFLTVTRRCGPWSHVLFAAPTSGSADSPGCKHKLLSLDDGLLLFTHFPQRTWHGCDRDNEHFP